MCTIFLWEQKCWIDLNYSSWYSYMVAIKKNGIPCVASHNTIFVTVFNFRMPFLCMAWQPSIFPLSSIINAVLLMLIKILKIKKRNLIIIMSFKKHNISKCQLIVALYLIKIYFIKFSMHEKESRNFSFHFLKWHFYPCGRKGHDEK